MENASKALIMAGGILIAMLIIGSLVLLFTSLADYQNNESINAKQSQVAEFNNQYEPFNKDNLTLNELKSIYNKIISNNKKYPEYEIETNIEEIYRNIATDDFTNNKIVSEDDKQTKIFKCTGIKYEGIDGRISAIYFGVAP